MLVSIESSRRVELLNVFAYRFDDVVDQLLCLFHLFFGVCHDKTVEVLLLVAGVRSIRAA